jgi:alpha-L-fucosidase
VVNDRLDLDDGWSFITPERFIPRGWVTVDGKRVPWEACTFMAGAWGYRQEDLLKWKSLEQCLTLLINAVSKGGNLLLNVAPTGRGEYDSRTLDRLSGMGEWMKRHSRSIYGCTQAPDEFKAPQDCRLTYNPDTNRMYVHVLAWPFEQLHLDGFLGRVAYAQLLNDHSEIRLLEKPLHTLEMNVSDKDQNTLTLVLPIEKPDVTFPVIELFMNEGAS